MGECMTAALNKAGGASNSEGRSFLPICGELWLVLALGFECDTAEGDFLPLGVQSRYFWYSHIAVFDITEGLTNIMGGKGGGLVGVYTPIELELGGDARFELVLCEGCMSGDTV